MDTRYSHQDHEQHIYQLWEKSKTFEPKNDPTAEPFTVIMPPPNANDPLHVGHAMFVALEDIMIRFARMQGKAALWLPGTDHAGIETQFVFEKKLAKNKQSRFDFDRHTLYQMIWEYVQENSSTAVTQIKKLGASADWSRFKFMLDEDIVSTVIDTFIKMSQASLVYRDLRLVHYCTHCGTAFSELEVEYKDQTTNLYYVAYQLLDDPTQQITLATTRPEPIIVDTHLAVHPDNPKTKHLIGKQVVNPLTDHHMPIIADEFVDPTFGTGIVKLTPAHDFADFDVAQKHNLPIIQAIGTDGRIVADAPLFAGLKVAQAREQAVALLKEKGRLEKVNQSYQNRIGSCYRCGRVLEPLPLPQFFINIKPLTQPIIKALDKGEITVHGAGHDKILRHWLENLKDWNITRQIVWGIRLPVWYEINNKKGKCDNGNLDINVSFLDSNKTLVRGKLGELLKNHSLDEINCGLQSLNAPTSAAYVISPTSPGDNYIQETDTFDTWFSSAQWPFSTLKNTKPGDFDRFYPTQVMETGYDILPFWVMRMLMVGQFVTGRLPFSTIYMHGLIRDTKGQKMSKSKGNVINPLDIVQQYGADALRMALVIRSSAGLDKNVGEPDFRAMRNLGNKIWNATRYVLSIQEQVGKEFTGTDEFYKKLNSIVSDVTIQLNTYKIGYAAETTYNSFWHWFCDESIEANKQSTVSNKDLAVGLVTFLKLLHPFVPFVTEAAYQALRDHWQSDKVYKDLVAEPLLITSQWPIEK